MIHNRAKQQKLAAEECQEKTRPRYEAETKIFCQMFIIHRYILEL